MGFVIRGRVGGLEETIKRLDGLKRRVKNTILRKAMRRATAIVLKAARGNCPKDTGLLRKSLGSKVKAYRQSGVVVGLVGPRKGFKQEVTRKGGGKMQADPVRYAHLVEFGRKEVTTTKTVLSDGTTVFGRSVRMVPPRPFLRPAWDQNKAAVREVIANTVAEELTKRGGNAGGV